MKKIIFLFVTLICLLWINLNGQSLTNTYWHVTLEGGEGDYIIHYSIDSVYLAENLDEPFYPFDKYYTQNDTFVIQAAYEQIACDTNEIGIYYFSIIDSIMRFTLIEDSCETRAFIEPQLIYTQLSYNPPININVGGEIKDTTDSNITFFPNPSPDGVFFYENNSFERPRYKIYNRWGALVRSGPVRESGEIHLPNESGIYYIAISWFQGWETFKLVRP